MFQRHLLFAAAFALVAGTAVAAEPDDIIKYRIATLKANGAHMAAAGAIINGKVDYKNRLADHARALAAVNKDIGALFPKDTDYGDTKALDAVWKNSAEFQKRAKDAAQKADAFARAVAAKDTTNTGAHITDDWNSSLISRLERGSN